MNWRAIGTVYGKEMRDSLRDYRTLISMIVIPTLAMPLLMFGVGAMMVKTMTKAQAEIPRVMIIGGGASSNVLSALRATGDFKIVPATDDFTNQIVQKQVRAAVRLPPDFDARVMRGDKAEVSIYVYQTDVASQFAAQRLDAFFRRLSDTTVRERLKNRNIPVEILKPFAIQQENVAPPAMVAGSLLGGLLPYLIIVMCFMGAMYPAIDVTVGEKERGTMETILRCPVARINLALGKFLAVFTISIATVILALSSMCGTFEVARRVMAQSLPPRLIESVSTIDVAGLSGVFVLLLPVAIMLSALMLMIGLFSKSFREAQSYAGPLMVLLILPVIPAILPGMELTPKLALVPLMNVSLTCREMLEGIWHWNYILLIFGSACVYAAIALGATVWMFHREGVIFRS
ncbi:MAG TPA: ABC transporter permease [Candidatus Sulfotelmatobacter sp.]|nr:ABC transporter permease [Candidatus Sulfotelmatobacter sp.]